MKCEHCGSELSVAGALMEYLEGQRTALCDSIADAQQKGKRESTVKRMVAKRDAFAEWLAWCSKASAALEKGD